MIPAAIKCLHSPHDCPVGTDELSPLMLFQDWNYPKSVATSLATDDDSYETPLVSLIIAHYAQQENSDCRSLCFMELTPDGAANQ